MAACTLHTEVWLRSTALAMICLGSGVFVRSGQNVCRIYMCSGTLWGNHAEAELNKLCMFGAVPKHNLTEHNP